MVTADDIILDDYFSHGVVIPMLESIERDFEAEKLMETVGKIAFVLHECPRQELLNIINKLFSARGEGIARHFGSGTSVQSDWLDGRTVPPLEIGRASCRERV